ncbi:MAG: FHA domain-containing protein [Actinobacteria bacterium]|nr:FHA domain-containing protein [Actinomycetota bacterium]
MPTANCGHQYSIGQDFCDECGAELPKTAGASPVPAPAAPPAPVSAAVAVVAAPSEVMVTCSKCNASVPQAAKCDQCGADLVTALSSTTAPASASASSGHRIVVVSTNRSIMLPDDRSQLLIGRADAASGNYPEVDLGIDEESVASGVSRKHAILRRDSSGMWSILDGDGVAGSANGTRVVTGGVTQKLVPGQSVSLSAGMELVLGAYKLRFE